MRKEFQKRTNRTHAVGIYGYSAVAAIVSLLMWLVGNVLRATVRYHFNGRPLPWLTTNLIWEPQLLLVLAIGWVIAAVFIARLSLNRPTLVMVFKGCVRLYVVIFLFLFSLGRPVFPFSRISLTTSIESADPAIARVGFHFPDLASFCTVRDLLILIQATSDNGRAMRELTRNTAVLPLPLPASQLRG
jgi:hypothetical protein